MDTKERQSMRRNPVETTNFLNLLFFGWTAPIFWKGAKRGLKIDDLYDPVTSNKSERLGDRLEKEWEKELKKFEKDCERLKNNLSKRPKKPSLLLAITRMFWIPYLWQGILSFVRAAVLSIILTMLQRLLISYFNPGENTMTQDQALLYAGLLVLVTLAEVFINHHVHLRTRQIGMSIRVACCSMIYRKILRLNQSAVSDTASGQVANLISNDVARFDEVSMYLNYIWIMPIQVTITGYVMWRVVGSAALIGMGALMIQTIPFQAYMGSMAGKLRSKIAVKTDERVQLMSELISGIQVVKMYAWEKPFELLVSRARKIEMKFIRYMSYLKGIDISMTMFTEQFSLYFTLIAFVLMGNTLTAEVAYMLQGLLILLNETCSINFPMAIVTAGEAAVSVRRISEFLLLDEVERLDKVESTNDKDSGSLKKSRSINQLETQPFINIEKVTANWIPNQFPPTLSDVSIKIMNHSLCAFVGPVGSGKSSLLHLIMGELPVETGNPLFFTDFINETAGVSSQHIRISYASQVPWLFSASIRDNILFGEPYDEERYKEVTRVCALDKDFEQLPQGDLSFVGERGASLSGGQRARVNLARAVYKDADLYLLDDPLSAVDPRVGRHLFEECITRFLQGKTRILVTHQLQYLPQTDSVVVLKAGVVECQGSYDELVKRNFENYIESDEKMDDAENNSTKILKLDSISKTGNETKNEENNVSSELIDATANAEDVDDEEMESGSMSSKVFSAYFKAGANVCLLTFFLLIFVVAQIVSSGTDYWVSIWSNQEIIRSSIKLNNSLSSETVIEISRNRSSESVWFDEDGLLSRNAGIYGYTALILCATFLILLRSVLMSKICMKASRNIHNSMFGNLLKSTMRFFNTNPAGRILNRFSKDVGTMDEALPYVMMVTMQIFALLCGIFALVVISNYWMIFPVIFICGLFYTGRIYYLKTAQDIKRIEGVAKSPMFSHANSTLDGLTTIRSRGPGAEKLLRREFDNHQDRHTSAWYIVIAISSAFGFMIDLISCSFIACVCFTFILMNAGDTLGGFVGLAISQSMMLCGSVQYGVKESTELISQMTSVERILQYTNLPKEGPFVSENPPPPTWPSRGSLIFRNLTMKYAEDKPPALKNVNAIISPGWKVGVVGRTGAGKSSLISALFRLTSEGLEGEIILDDIDTGAIGLHEFRPRISIIPQEPILFSATLRYNLDPFDEYEDSKLWDSLREVELGHVVVSLDSPVAAAGANFSVGQRQLICLARALLRNNRILVLDEATANIDHSTDALIQRTIRRRFADCTVLTIAHRLNTIMDSDRVLVMSEGRVVEFDHPHLLLQNRDGRFSEMVKQTGDAMAEQLALIAQDAYESNPEFMKNDIEQMSVSFADENTRL